MIRHGRFNNLIRSALWVQLFLSRLKLFGGNVVNRADMTRTQPISPSIYGINADQSLSDPPRNLTLNRAGGNRWTAYNWENNVSNADEAVRSIITGKSQGSYRPRSHKNEALIPFTRPTFREESARVGGRTAGRLKRIQS